MKAFNKISVNYETKNQTLVFGFAFITFCLVLVIAPLTNNYSQVPNPINIDTLELYQHGTNSDGADAQENTDSVSVGSSVYYYSMPDSTTNSGFHFYINPYNNVTDTFVWSVNPAAGSAVNPVPGHLTATHFKRITWSTTGVRDIDITVTTDNNCSSVAPTTAVEVIAKPTVQFSSTTNSACVAAGTDGSVGYSLSDLPVNWTSVVKGNKNLSVNISITCSNAGFGAALIRNNVAVEVTGAGTGTFDVPVILDYFGLYTITLTAINDRISSKCETNGSVVAPASFTFLLSKNPVSGRIYHLPNTDNY